MPPDGAPGAAAVPASAARRDASSTGPAATAPFVVAVDGPAASGKGTLARRLAAHFGLRYLDTGLLYRAVGAEAVRRRLNLADEVAVAAVARALDLWGLQQQGAAAASSLRTDAAAQAASRVSALPAVRAALLQAQRDFAAGAASSSAAGAVLDGRDIGTTVYPDAQAKLYVTASAEVRARRRFLELQSRIQGAGEGEGSGGGSAGGGKEAAAAAPPAPPPPSFEQVLGDLEARDARDAGRAVSPLRAADDALVLDTSGMDADAAFEAARAYVEERRRRWDEGDEGGR